MNWSVAFGIVSGFALAIVVLGGGGVYLIVRSARKNNVRR